MKSPKAPDPYQTAQAQSQFNTNTALAQQAINMVGQVNPYGSVTYDQTGTNSFVGADGKTYTIPSYTQTTSFTPTGQKIFDNVSNAQTSLSQTAANQAQAVQDTLSNPFTFTNQDAANWSYDLAQSRIAPQQQQATEALRTLLINSGLRPGTAGYEREMMRLGQNQTDQNNQLALQGRAQAFNEQLTGRNQSLNELNALLSGSQLQNPGTASPATPHSQVAGVDYSGLVQNNYQQQLQNRGGMLGGLFGLAGSLGGAAITGGLFK